MGTVVERYYARHVSLKKNREREKEEEKPWLKRATNG
jgi:hypothetical protein